MTLERTPTGHVFSSPVHDEDFKQDVARVFYADGSFFLHVDEPSQGGAHVEIMMDRPAFVRWLQDLQELEEATRHG